MTRMALIMKLKIEGYAFGRMMFGGREYTSDLMIYPDGRVQANWWRERGHTLLPGDIALLLNEAPVKLIIGTGTSGLMSVSESVLELCEKSEIIVEASRTVTAVKRFNEVVDQETDVAACFHLTC